MKILKTVETGLREISLPPLTRPPIGPDDPTTEALAVWGATTYAYCSIAQVRTVLAGLLTLADAGNTPTGIIVARHIFEWTAHACYMKQHLGEFFAKSDWKSAFELTLKADTGNAWVKKHGHNYDPTPSPVDVLDPLRINKLISAYVKYKTEADGKSTIEDDYGYLSERSHPNGFCFQQYRKIVGQEANFVAPPTTSTFGGVNGFTLEWLMFIHDLLALAKEDPVRKAVGDVLAAAVMPAGWRG